MRRRFLYIAFLFQVVISLLFHAHAADQSPVYDSVSNRISKITIASEPNYPPYCIVDSEGNADGFSVELFKAAAAAMGIEVDVKAGLWNKIKQDLATGRIDALPLVGRTPEREELFDFTFPYLSLHGAIFVRKGDTGIRSLEDLKGKEIIVMKGDNAEEFVRRENISTNIITTLTFKEAFQLLATGKHDAVITQRLMGLQLLDEINIDSIAPLDIQLDKFRQDFCFAVRKGDSRLLARLNEGLSIVIANGTYDKIHLKWFGPVIKEHIAWQDVVRIGLSILLPSILVFCAILIIVLRSEVKKKTKGLKQEIQQRKEIEKKLHESRETYLNLFQNAQVGLFRTRIEDGKILQANEQIAQMFGYSGRKEFVYEYSTSNNYVDYGTRDKMLEQIRDTGEIRNFEARFYRKDKSIFWASYSAKIYSQQGWIEGVVEDITYRKQKEDELNKLKNELELKVAERTKELEEKVAQLDKSEKAMLFMVEDLNRVNKALKQERLKLEVSNKELEAFSYSVSHDLRAPLRSIHGFGQFLLEEYSDKLDEQGRHYLDRVIAGTKRMGLLIDDLLELSRTSRKEMHRKAINLSELAREVVDDLKEEHPERRVDIQISEGQTTFADPHLLKTVMENLLGNAWKFTEKCENAEIEFGMENMHGETVFFIKDNGAGFNPDYKDNLFAPFKRLHSDREFTGNGIGLANVARIIHRHGGRIWAESEGKGKGAAFFFTLESPNLEKKGTENE